MHSGDEAAKKVPLNDGGSTTPHSSKAFQITPCGVWREGGGGERGRDTKIPEGRGVAEGAGNSEVELPLFSLPALPPATLEEKDW